MIAVPNDVWWILKVPVQPGQATPYHCWLLWHAQFVPVRGGALA